MDYLVHHGILGQKWGIRRYQNKDGSLTEAGKRRKAKLEAELGTLNGKANTNQEKKKSFRDMSDDELRNATNRLKAEEEYKKYYANAHPAKVTIGKRISNKLLNEAIPNAISTASQSVMSDLLKNIGNYASNSLQDSLGISNKSPKSSKELWEERAAVAKAQKAYYQNYEWLKEHKEKK